MATSVPRLLVIGLGNLPYPSTRHSIGQLIIDNIAVRFGIRLIAERGGISGRGNANLNNSIVDLTLFKSKSLMNISGPSIATTFRKSGLPASSMIVLSDSLSHQVGRLHCRLGGSANGHNGLKSIISALGGETGFHQFRVGIGRDETDSATYVMRRLSSYEHRFWAEDGLDLVISGIQNVADKSTGQR